MIRTLIGLALLAVALSFSLAVALSFSTVASAKGFYVSTSFGPNWDGDSSLPFVDEETGLVGTLAVGTSIDDAVGLRAEIEASFRTHDSNVGPFVFEHDTTAVMANLAYDFTGASLGRFTPYVLVGAGVAHTELTFGGLAPLTVENDGFAWQAGAGFNYRISENVSAGLGYRYAEMPEVELFGFELDGGSNHAVMANVTVGFN